ncbi:hypothetical protein QTN47_01390 [Danxiaibacter flavus]|uniref:DUF4595 domain-containing protein n=1 Tax=Danxiaibacter flavus TaxID=3049108 RepID=A0ABV3Z9C1_9BACT|nr:hypothetical protein QNM32_01390 [Chitinophagaceae bacterium DXS]
MKWLLFVSLLVTGSASFGQYYYYDVIAARQTQIQNELLKENKIKKVSAVSYESDNSVNETFKVEQSITQDGDLIITNSTDGAGVNTYSESSFINGRVVKNIDSSRNIKTTSVYRYDSRGKLLSINSESRDAFMGGQSQEQHIWTYNAEKPQQMLRIKDKKDTTVISFVFDDQGNVAEELWKKKNMQLEHWFYYYDANHRLTDIVRYNTKAKRMLPDYLFEYDEKGKLMKMTQIPAGSSNYLVWSYQFDDKGLKTAEICTNKQNQPVGKIVYRYQ